MKLELSEDARRVLAAVSERAMDGYTLRSKTDLPTERLSTAARELVMQDLLLVKGGLEEGRVLEAYFFVPTSAKHSVFRILGPS